VAEQPLGLVLDDVYQHDADEDEPERADVANRVCEEGKRVQRRDDVRGLWLQLGIRDDAAAKRARDAGLAVVQDRCLKVEHGRLA